MSQPLKMRDSWTWLLVLYTGSSFFETVFWGQMSAFTPIFLAKLGLPANEIPSMVGIVAAIVGGAGIPFLPFWGALADKYSRKPMIVRSFAVYLLAGSMAVLAGNVWVFVIGRSLMGLALGNSGLMMTTLAERTPPNRLGLAFAVMNSAGPVGAFIGPLVGGPIVDAWGFRTLMWINVVVMLVVIAGLSLGYAEVYRGSADRSIQRMAADSVRVSFQSGRLRTLFGAFIFLYAGWMLVYAYLPVFVAHLYRGANPASAIGYVLGSAGVLSMLLSPAFGAAADRLGHWRVLMIGAALETLLWIVPYWTRMLVPFAALVCLTSAVSAAVFSISFNVLSSSAPSSIRGRVMAFAYMPVNVGFSLGPMIGSQLVKIDLFYIFPTACILTAFGLVGLGLARRQPMLADPTGSNPVAT